MYTVLKFVSLLYTLIESSNTQNFTDGVCDLKPFTCCVGYRRKGDKCEVCFPGTFGINCKYTCPNGFYGIRCKEKCKCSSCDKISGACQTNNSETEATEKRNLTWWMYLVAVGLVLVGMFFGYVIFKKCSPVHQPSIYFNTSNRPDQNASEQKNYTALQKKGEKKLTESNYARNTEDIPNSYIEICD